MPWMTPNPASNIVKTIPSPTGGLNAFDNLANMPPMDAPIMRNWWPQPYGLSVRKGTRDWMTNLGDSVNTLASWNAESGVSKLFAWSGPYMFDASSRAPVPPPMLFGLTNSHWQTVQQSNVGGNHLIAVNGVDDGILYNDTGVHRLVAGDGIVPHTWFGLDPQDAIEVTVHQGRLWAAQVNSSKGWYLPVGAIQGTFVAFDFGPLFPHGGYLAQLTTWTIDDGNGAEDHLVAVSSRGDAVVYQGTDPSDDLTWQLVGVYYIGAPVIGRRALVKMAGDLVAMTDRGLISMSAMLVSTKVKDNALLKTEKIQYLLSENAQALALLEGWSVNYWPNINMLMVNVPSVTTVGPIQVCANDLAPGQPWTTFQGMDAQCWKLYENQVMFGTSDGKVMQAWYGNVDNLDMTDANGVAINSAVQQSYNYFDGPALQKQLGLYRLNFTTNNPAGIEYSTKVEYDFAISPLVASTQFANGELSVWNSAIWDEGLWTSTTLEGYSTWIHAQGVGNAVSISISAQTTSALTWISTDYSLKKGGLL